MARLFCELPQLEGGTAAISRLAGHQRGVVHLWQLRAAGLGRNVIARLVRQGLLHPVFPRAYAVGHAALTPLGRELAALLHAGHDAFLSHGSATGLWGMTGLPPEDVMLTVVGRHIGSREGLETHRVKSLRRDEVRLREGLPVTSPARGLIDYASGCDDASVVAAVAQARVLGLATDAELERTLDRHPNRPGSARLRRVLAGEIGPELTRSEAERLMRGLLLSADLPVPEINVRWRGFEVDFMWREQKLVVEVDGYRFHSGYAAFERDRRRDQQLLAAGYRVLRVTWRQLVNEPMALAVRIGQALMAGV